MSATIGVPRRRVDAEQKVRGATRYAADLPIAGVLHGRLVLATEAHARVTGIDADAARAMPGVVAVLTAGDLPVSPDAPGRAGEPLAREEVVFAGQPVAMVVAESEAAAPDGGDAVGRRARAARRGDRPRGRDGSGRAPRAHDRARPRRRRRRRRPRRR